MFQFFSRRTTELLSITKLQNLKAIHNGTTCLTLLCHVVINHKTIKFESNSQHSLVSCCWCTRCYQSQNYKIWKQFTTFACELLLMYSLLSITKLQNLKAIHNSNSRRWRSISVVINHKTTKFESNSQQAFVEIIHLKCCYQSQNYKIWKQFTTVICLIPEEGELLSITKPQNLKAIHNRRVVFNFIKVVVINHKTTKFESNSQNLSNSSTIKRKDL